MVSRLLLWAEVRRSLPAGGRVQESCSVPGDRDAERVRREPGTSHESLRALAQDLCPPAIPHCLQCPLESVLLIIHQAD